MAASTTLAHALESRVQVFNSYYPAMLVAAVDARAPLPLPVSNEALEAERTLHRNAVVSLLQGFDVPEECLHVSMGVASEFLPRMAEQLQVDIMVMGALSRASSLLACLLLQQCAGRLGQRIQTSGGNALAADV